MVTGLLAGSWLIATRFCGGIQAPRVATFGKQLGKECTAARWSQRISLAVFVMYRSRWLWRLFCLCFSCCKIALRCFGLLSWGVVYLVELKTTPETVGCWGRLKLGFGYVLCFFVVCCYVLICFVLFLFLGFWEVLFDYIRGLFMLFWFLRAFEFWKRCY